eukprot:CAMPEP_0197274596 /NCGR_PEP_ID=MMETSP1432-20130617/12897_1 /TAXON_ID=44447 /ORGANISM="Pseudo-nitzschia delicatissima, Strain UNC1205" /LENGTH=477 /DNA_ID=CAMNT_0042740409 /DNA_START=23 /DNA_END=1456 /DNA_ORIENTATION=-
MDLVVERDEPDHRRMLLSLEEEDEATEAEDTDSEQAEEEVKQEEQEENVEVVKNNSDIEIPPKPEDYEEPDQTLQDSKIELAVPTEPPQATKAPAPTEPPLPIEKKPPNPETDATITDLAKQEIGNWMDGGPKVPGETEQKGESDENTGDETADSDTDEKKDSNTEPSEMDIVVPNNEEEEEAINENIETWEEEHGKQKPDVEDEDEDDDDGGMDIPQTEEEEQKVNEEIEEWEEEHGKPKPQTEVTTEAPEDSGSSYVDIPIAEEETNGTKDEEEPIDTSDSTSAPESLETANPLIVSPSWTPPKIEPVHTLKPREPTTPPVKPLQPTLAPVPMPTSNVFSTPTGSSMTSNHQEDQACQEYDPQTASYLLCKNNIPPMAGSIAVVGVPLLIILCCCWKYCCGRSKKDINSRGEYRQVANTYGDASFDNAFSEDISDDEDDLEDASWGESNGRRVLEMRNMGQRKGDDDLSLEEMNG